MQKWFYLVGDQKDRLVFSWWPSSGRGQNRFFKFELVTRKRKNESLIIEL